MTWERTFSQSESINILAYGETTLDGDMNITPYFEAMYNSFEVYQEGLEAQLFPDVPALNPYNLCNPDAENGVDCGLAYDAFLSNPGVVSQFQDYYAGFCEGYFGANFGLPPEIAPLYCTLNSLA